MAPFPDRQPFSVLAPFVRVSHSPRRHAAVARFVDNDDDPCVDQAFVDPLDDRDRRCDMRARSA